MTAGHVKKNSMLQLLSKWSFPPAPAGDLRGLLCDLYCGNLVKFPMVNLIILWSTPYDWVSLEFLPLRLVHIESASIHQLQFKFPSLTLVFKEEPVGSAGGFLLCCDGLYLPICLPSLGGGGRDLPCGLIFLIDLRRVVDFSTSYTVNMKQHLIYTCSLNFIGKLICWIAFHFQVVQW